jgi:hypothetical protein
LKARVKTKHTKRKPWGWILGGILVLTPLGVTLTVVLSSVLSGPKDRTLVSKMSDQKRKNVPLPKLVGVVDWGVIYELYSPKDLDTYIAILRKDVKSEEVRARATKEVSIINVDTLNIHIDDKKSCVLQLTLTLSLGDEASFPKELEVKLKAIEKEVGKLFDPHYKSQLLLQERPSLSF